MNKKIIAVQQKYGQQIALKAMESGAIQLSPEKPFTWVSGYKMPIYNDNRRLLAFPQTREMICTAFGALLKAVDFSPDWIAGVATGGIPHGAILADKLRLPFAYIRSESKDHGLKNTIEGLGANADFRHKKVLIIEDLISTGGSSIKAVNAVRSANGAAPYCFAIFSYGLDKAISVFDEIRPQCTVMTILNYDILLDVAVKTQRITEVQKRTLQDWRSDPFHWWEKSQKKIMSRLARGFRNQNNTN